MPSECGDEKNRLVYHCNRCGKELEWKPGTPRNEMCAECLTKHPKNVRVRDRYGTHGDAYRRVMERKGRCKKETAEYNKDYKEANKERLLRQKKELVELKRKYLYEEPCLMCPYGKCSGIKKIISITSLPLFKETGSNKGAPKQRKETIEKLCDRSKFMVACTRHAAQYNQLRHNYPEMSHDDIVDEMIRRNLKK